MKNKTLQILGLAVIAAVGFTACDGLGKMVKKANTVQYTVTPNPIEMHGDTITVTVAGKFPPKYFGKKVALTVTPIIKYNGGEKELKPITIIGEKALGTGTKVPYTAGGSFAYSDRTAYVKGMEKATVEVKAQGVVKKKKKDLPQIKIADGTIVTPFLVKSDEKSIMGKDAFTKTKPVSANSVIYYVVNQSTVRPTEMKNDEMKAFKEFVEKGVAKGYDLKGASISAYASPDGEQSLNTNLANERAASAAKALMSMFKDKKTKVEAAQKEEFYSKVGKGEDWDGFKSMMEQSEIKDKDLILRVLTMYSDLDQREKEIKNLAKTYTEVSDKILPKLRRSMITLNGEEKSRTDEQITKLATSTPDSLSVEELLYAGANLTTDMNTKLSIYKAAERMYPTDWRAINNAGCIYLMQNKVNDAETQFNTAAKVDAKNTTVKNNQGIVARWKGDRKKAMEIYKEAAGAGPEVNYNMGIIDIMDGNYASAVSNFGTYNAFNMALAKVLNGSPDAAVQVIDASDDKDSALGYYLKAIIGARTGKADMAVNNLKTAIGKDASYKEKARDDAEFLKIKDNAEYKALVQ
jgi:tetratricopeptide (TPR) repeat protein